MSGMVKPVATRTPNLRGISTNRTGSAGSVTHHCINDVAAGVIIFGFLTRNDKAVSGMKSAGRKPPAFAPISKRRA